MLKNITYIGFLILLIACKKVDIKDVDDLVQIDRSPLEIVHNVEFIFSDSALVRAKIKSPLMENYHYDDNPYSEMRKGVEVIFYDKNFTPNAFMRSNYGKRYSRSKMTHLKDDVVVVNLKNDTLNTDELIWDEKKELVFSEKFVRVKTADEIIYSQGFESDPAFSYYKFYKIRGTSLKTPE